MKQPRIAFAGDRDIAVWALEYILNSGVKPLALLVSGQDRASHADELISLCSFLGAEDVIEGDKFRQPSGISRLRKLDLDYILCVHFPYIVPEEVLSLPRFGVLNLHPAYLPYNRGWHTPSWAILEDTPAGATLHFMDETTDTGDIVHRKRLEISAGDTAHSLYARLKGLELEVFKDAWLQLVSGSFERKSQRPGAGSFHKREDLFDEAVQRIDLDAVMRAGDLIRRLRALTTSKVEEAAYYESDGRRFRLQVVIYEEQM